MQRPVFRPALADLKVGLYEDANDALDDGAPGGDEPHRAERVE